MQSVLIAPRLKTSSTCHYKHITINQKKPFPLRELIMLTCLLQRTIFNYGTFSVYNNNWYRAKGNFQIIILRSIVAFLL